MASSCSSDTEGSAEATIGSMRSSFRPDKPAGAPASIGPPDTNTVGMFSRMVAISMPGVILSQFEMQIIASAQCAFTMYSTELAISSRLGSEYSIPPCPMAMPSSTAIVLNSLADRPGGPDSVSHHLADLAQVHVPGDELGETVRDGDDRLADVFPRHAGGAQQGAGARHVPAGRDRTRPGAEA